MRSFASKGMVAVLAASMSCGLLAGCSSATSKTDEAQGMTDDEIMVLIEKGDADTLAKAKSETEKAVSAALANIGKLTDEDKAALKKSILSEVDARIDGIKTGTYTTDQYVTNTYTTDQHVTENNAYTTVIEGSSTPPRITDGAPVTADWSIDKTFTDSDGCTYSVQNVDAKAYNFSADSPYAGGGYAYRIEVTVSGSFNPKPSDPDTGISAMHTAFPLPFNMVLSPHDVAFYGTHTASINYKTKTFTNKLVVGTNMIPESVSAIMQQ